MALKIVKRYLILFIFSAVGYISSGQSVPKGIFYQAVARDNYGKELVNKDIDVKFSIISGTPLGTVVYQELHSHVITSKFGVFTRVIGTGTYVGGVYEDLSQIQWSTADHFLKVEVKFDNDFLDMGTMQFLTVPYALYAQKSLEPGPAGPKGDPGPKGDAGDPSTDSQTLSFNGSNLAISGGNTVNLSSLNPPHQLSLIGDTLSILGGNKVGLTNQIQDLALDINNKLKITKNSAATEIDLSPFKQNLSYNNSTGILSISNGTGADLSSLEQTLLYDAVTRKLSISGIAGTVDLSELKNDADSDPTNELQSLTYDANTGDLSISSKNTVNLLAPAGFKAKKSTSETGLTTSTTYPFVCPEVEFNDGSGYNSGTGNFVAPTSGIYTFDISYKADGTGSGRSITMFKNVDVYEILWPDINSGSELTKFVTMKLDEGDIVYLKLFTGLSTNSGTGSFIGYKVN